MVCGFWYVFTLHPSKAGYVPHNIWFCIFPEKISSISSNVSFENKFSPCHLIFMNMK